MIRRTTRSNISLTLNPYLPPPTEAKKRTNLKNTTPLIPPPQKKETRKNALTLYSS
jgi:hypothetical protein